LHKTRLVLTTPLKGYSQLKFFHLWDELTVTKDTKIELYAPEYTALFYMTDLKISLEVIVPQLEIQKTYTSPTGFVLECSAFCRSCFGAKRYNCETCHPNFYLQDNRCKCYDDGHFQTSIFIPDALELSGFRNEVVCDRCFETCHSCIGPTDYHCLVCSETSFKVQFQIAGIAKMRCLGYGDLCGDYHSYADE
jgi:hypothetical protein